MEDKIIKNTRPSRLPGIKKNKERVLKELEKTMGIVTTACKKAKICPCTFYDYVKKDAEFAKAVENIKDVQIDFVESKFLNNIKNGDVTSSIFYLKTKGKHRGYTETIETVNTHKVDAAFADVSMTALEDILKRSRSRNGKD